MFELNGSYSDVQKRKTKTANRSPFWLPKIGTLVETIEERCLSAQGGGGGVGGGKGDRNGQKFSGKLVTFETIAIEILPLSRSF